MGLLPTKLTMQEIVYHFKIETFAEDYNHDILSIMIVNNQGIDTIQFVKTRSDIKVYKINTYEYKYKYDEHFGLSLGIGGAYTHFFHTNKNKHKCMSGILLPYYINKIVDSPILNKFFHFTCCANPLHYLQYIIMIMNHFLLNNNYIQDIKYPILSHYINIMY